MKADDELFQRTLDHLRKLCSVREYCVSDIRGKAGKRLTDSDDIARIISTLQEEAYLDENRYAAAFARDKAILAGWGPIKIKAALSAKGIGRETIDDAIDGIDGDKADEKLRKAIELKGKSLRGDSQIKLKLLRFGLSRGYDYDSVRRAVDRALQSQEI